MNESALHLVMKDARNCAMTMLENATYIQSELVNVQMSNALQAQTEEICATLIGTKHDIISELFELDELLKTKASTSVIVSRVYLIMEWLRDDIGQMQKLVMSLESASKQDRSFIGAYVLVAESAKNILNAFIRFKTATSSLSADADEHPNA